MADKEAERIKFATELLRITALAVLAIGGGSISLLLGDPTPLRLILAIGGLLVTLGLTVAGWRQRGSYSDAHRADQGDNMTGMEIIATCIGIAILATVGLFVWKLTNP
jgi:hypothetical protein